MHRGVKDMKVKEGVRKRLETVSGELIKLSHAVTLVKGDGRPQLL